MKSHLSLLSILRNTTGSLRSRTPASFAHYPALITLSRSRKLRSYSTAAPNNENAALIELGYVYEHIEDVEPLERYQLGGYHPVSLNELLCQGRYRIIHKLGYGGHSTVWLGWDVSRSRCVAIKISTADCQNEALQSRLLPQLSTSLSRSIVDSFDLVGPNGRHRCLVTAPAMMSLQDAQEASVSGFFQLPVARALVTQIVQGVGQLHDKGVVHGDLHPGNILFRLPDEINRLTSDQLYRNYGEPESVLIKRLDGAPLDDSVPSEAVVPIWLGKKSEDVGANEAMIFLGDFGESYLASEETRHYSNSPFAYRPPESHFPQCSKPFSFSSDVWSLGCLIWEVLGQRPLFDTRFATEDEVLDDQVNLLGKLPLEWWANWEARNKYWVEEGESIKFSPTRHPDHKKFTWENRLERCIQEGRRDEGLELISEDEQADLFAMMKLMLVMQPDQRASVKEILGSAWIRRWALPDFERMQ